MVFNSMVAAFLMLLAGSCFAQSNQQDVVQDQVMGQTHFIPVRLIEDRATHRHWMLFKDSAHPAAPDKFITLAENVTSSLFEKQGDPMIHTGDQVFVVQHTAVADLRIAGRALGMAALGERLSVRLKGGVILTAIATGPGQATLLAGTGEVRW